MNKKEKREWLALATRNGARIEDGKKHIKVWASDGRYLLSISHGLGTSTNPKTEEAYRVARREGWS